jgi:hypothetical protein
MTTPFQQEHEEKIATGQANFIKFLVQYDAVSAIHWWFDTLRASEELINLMTVDWDDDSFQQRLLSFPVSLLHHHIGEFQYLRHVLKTRFSETFVNRFSILLTQGAAIAASFATNDIFWWKAGPSQ